MATIREVAKRAGVSLGTVSHVISGSSTVSEELRERVLAAIRELDYHPSHVARSLKVKQTKMLGMVISDITNPFFPQLVRGAEEAAQQHGYVLVTFNTDDRVEREKQALSEIRSRRMDGVLLVVAPNHGDHKHIEAFMASGTPIVCLDRLPGAIAADCVFVDGVKGAQVCTRHLISRGYRRIAIITGNLQLRTAIDRLKGYEAALKEAGIEEDPALIVEGDFREAAGYKLGKDLLLRYNRPDAIFVSNGMMTSGLLLAMREIGLECPGDVAVATFDELPFSGGFRPQLTCVAQPAHEMGFRGAELLIQRIQRKLPEGQTVSICLEPELKLRESTASRLSRALTER